MASLARVLAWHGRDLPRARELAADAVAAARQAGDPRLVAACLVAQHNAIWRPGTAADRRGLAAEVIELAEGDGTDPELVIEARLLAATDLLELADPAFRAELEEFLRLAGLSGQPRLSYAAMVRRAALALLAGRLAEAQRVIRRGACGRVRRQAPGPAPVRSAAALRRSRRGVRCPVTFRGAVEHHLGMRSEEHTSELQSRRDLVCRLLLEKKKKQKKDVVLQHNKKTNFKND